MDTKTTFHRDGTLTYWSVYAQAWRHRRQPTRMPAAEVAALPAAARERVIALQDAARERQERAPGAPTPPQKETTMRYVLNSAVLTAFGRWEYQPLEIPAVQSWLGADPYVSTIGYAETAQALEEVCGLAPGSVPVQRTTITMQPGDEALVFRLVFPSGYRPDPTAKGKLGREYILKHSECGLLRRLA